MFTKEESTIIRQEFWTSFGKSFPRKWLLYNTKIKNFAFKFVADRKQALVCLDIDMKNNELRGHYWDKMLSLKNILKTQYINLIIYDNEYLLENGKSIYRIYIQFPDKFSIHNKKTWYACYQFFIKQMTQFELFFEEYEDFIKN
ncbi:MAG: DUF4268 domain-containing protein [Flavobacteriaceae bacterium]